MTTKTKERALTLQEREVHRYYQPWLDAHGSGVNISQHVNDLAETTDFAMSSLSNMGYRARQSRDKALTAFAQLATLRLNVRRCMVSLIDSSHQYVLAEATKTLSLVDESRHADSDELWLGSTSLARNDAMCECSMKRTHTIVDPRGNKYTTRAAIIPDCRKDPEYNDKPYVISEPGVRFYAGVPIKTRSGHLIGVYAVSDEVPSETFSYEDLRFMEDISVAIMDHLEWARDRVDRYKGERIVRGMADFIECSPSMRAIKESRDAEDLANAEMEAQVTGSAPLHSQTGGTSDNRMPTPRQSPRLAPHGSHFSNIPQEGTSRRSSPVRLPSAPPAKREKGDSLTRMLDRAARILRDSTLAEGVVFFGPNGNGTNAKSNLRASMSARERFSDREGTGTDEDKRLSSNELVEGEASTDSDGSHQLKSSKILGISLTNKKDVSLFHNTALAVNTLEMYFKLFPNGKSFHFSEAGSGLSSEDDSASESQKDKRSGDDHDRNEDHAIDKVLDRKKKIKMTHTELLKNLPGVKNVIFLPLWDYVEEKMVAGCFLWTSTTGRMMNLDDDLSYLRAFGNTIMSEVARMNAQKDDRAKTTFIASMSHELRSPLHGILGSVEFLQDTSTDSYQTGLINSIATCGKTLLDTLDHVLDYAKINKLGRAKMRKNARLNKVAKVPVDSSLESLNITAEIDLGVVVEEVVEAVCAGHAFKMMHTRDLHKRANNAVAFSKATAPSSAEFGPAYGDNLRDGEVSVLLDISPRVSWKVRTQPGALRRIIMNLLGNALKYTASGFVAVSLRAQENANHNKIDAIFRVVDSGKGMSDDFLKNRLFVPFSQEDSFQPGTGLGLSIVRQIVDSLGGSIELKSVQGVGTEVDVHLSLTPADGGFDVPDEDITSIAKRTRGLRLCLLDPNQEKGKPSNDRIARLDTTLREVCYGWFEMELMTADSMHGTDADIFMYTEPPSIAKLLEHHGINNSTGQEQTGRDTPLLIVCLNASEAIEVSSNHKKSLSQLGKIVEVIPQPCGPRKIAKVLAHCLRRMEEAAGKPVQQPAICNTLPIRSPVEDQGSASLLGVPSNNLPNVSSTPEALEESSRTREYLKEIATEVPPSAAVAFPSDTKPPLNSQQVGKIKDLQTASSDIPHVLLVDDNKINLQLLVMFMRKNKFTYVEAQNGQEALDRYIESCEEAASYASSDSGVDVETPTPPRRKKFDFVLMDISMPVMNGMESTRRIREYEVENGLPRTTVIALTGLASASAQQEAESSGIDIYMAKPVKFQELRPLLVRKDSCVS